MSFSLILLLAYIILLSTLVFDGILSRNKLKKSKILITSIIILVLYFIQPINFLEIFYLSLSVSLVFIISIIMLIRHYKLNSISVILYAFLIGLVLFIFNNALNVQRINEEYVIYTEALIISVLSVLSIKKPRNKLAFAIVTSVFITFSEFVWEMIFSGYSVLYIGLSSFSRCVGAFIFTFLISDIVYLINRNHRIKKSADLKNMAFQNMNNIKTKK